MKTLYLITIASIGASVAFADNWHQFRGPSGIGLAEGEVPTSWSKDSVAWQVSLPGEGQSSAVNWGPKLFVTAASQEGGMRTLLCLDKDSGKTIWRRDVESDRKESQHKMNSCYAKRCNGRNSSRRFFWSGRYSLLRHGW